jgi:hypothetical protein
VDQSRQRLLFGGASGRSGVGAPSPQPPSSPHERAYTAYVDVVRERVAIGGEELARLVAARLGLDPSDPGTEELLGDVELDVMEDPAAPVTVLVPDLVVHAPTLTDGIVLTHRLSAAERAEEHLDLDADLAGFLRHPEPRVATGPLHVDDAEADDPVRWGGPRGWLADLPDGALLAVRATAGGEVTIAVLDVEPVAPPELTAALLAEYRVQLDDPGLPVEAEALVLGMLYRDPSVFAEPRPPLTELAAAAGLERHRAEFAHDESVWAAADAAEREFRLLVRAGGEERVEAALEAFRLLADDPRDPAVLRRALDLLGEPEVLAAVLDELLPEPDEHGERVAAVVALADRLLAAAGRTPREAVARWIAAFAAERDGRALDAESHLRAASVASGGWPIVEDRLAWYESDRGDAAAALGRWRDIEMPEDDPDVAAVRPFATAPGPEPGRNERCWCGSGRKYKQCHLGRPVQASLPARAQWLYRKAAAYVERRGGAAGQALERCAEDAVPDGDDDDVDAAFDNPVVIDAVLHEGGWFAVFLADRGPLLPADEAALAASWAGVDRSVFEVEGIRFGEGATVRDLRTGARLDVTTAPAGRNVTMGELVSARALPDGSGSGHLLVGAVFGVQRGIEDELLGRLGTSAGPGDDR